jgi:large subunit ribosomal protein L25
MSEIILPASIRTETGKGPSRRARNKQELPAVLYVKGQPSTHLLVSPKIATKLLMGPLRRNTVINLSIDNGGKAVNKLVMVKERQIHQTRRELIHLDFVEVNAKTPVPVSVPVKLSGKSETVTLGGKLEHVLQKIRVACLPHQIPEFIEVDITSIGFGSTHAGDIKLPAGLSLVEKPNNVLLTIKKPRGSSKDEEAAKEGGAPAKGKK